MGSMYIMAGSSAAGLAYHHEVLGEKGTTFGINKIVFYGTMQTFSVGFGIEIRRPVGFGPAPVV